MKIPTLKIDGVFYKLVLNETIEGCEICAFADMPEKWCNRLSRLTDDELFCGGDRHYKQLEVQDLPEADVEHAPNILTGVNK